MPYFETSQEWLDQSTLLFEAYPTTSRVTTTYNILKRKRTPVAPTNGDETASTQNAVQPPASGIGSAAARATLTLKTYDPVSGVCLKYRTDKEREVGRLIASLGRLGRHMAALPEENVVTEAVGGGLGGKVEASTEQSATRSIVESQGTAHAQSASRALGEQAPASGSAAGGGKKKKKGKR